MEDTIENFENIAVKERPTFILVLCILSWVYVGIAILSAVTTATKSDEDIADEIDVAIATFETGPLAGNPMAESMIEFTKANSSTQKRQNIVNLILMLIEGFAVFMIFSMKKIGFWLYTLVQIGTLVALAYFFPWPNIMSTAIFGFTTLTVLVFEILYAVNYKHLS